MTALLLEAGADPDDGTSVRGAADADDPACLRLLLEAGATVVHGMALATAVRRGRRQTAELLLDRGPARWGERENALQWAVHADAAPEMIRLLVERGADLEASFDGSGRTPYGVAVRSGRRDLAEVLAALGAQRRVEPLDELLGACVAGDGATAKRLAAERPQAAQLLRTSEAGVLVEAAREGRREAVRTLLDLGVPVDTRGEPGGATALRAATEAGDGDLIALLLARGADPGKRAGAGGAAPAPSPDEPPYGELAWAAQESYLRLLAGSPLAEQRPCGDGIAVITGVSDNTENGVVCGRLDGNPDAAIVETLAWFAERRAPAQWLLADRVEPADLRERLVAAGASAERTAVVMGAELHRLALDEPTPSGLEIVAVRDAAALHEWMAIAAVCTLDASAQERARRAAIAESLGLGDDAPLQLRLARRTGQAIGMASYVLDGETVLGQHVGVLAAERRAGVGRALVQAAGREARAAGARVAVLGPTPETIAFYSLLGFVLRPWPRDRSFYLPLPYE
jgi:GNAT superfamily N-acetyltransferase